MCKEEIPLVTYHNAMETLVEEAFDKISDKLDCCTCELCRNDIIAYALNQLKPKYVVTEQGAMYSKANSTMKVQPGADIIAALSAGANLVRAHKRHP